MSTTMNMAAFGDIREGYIWSRISALITDMLWGAVGLPP